MQEPPPIPLEARLPPPAPQRKVKVSAFLVGAAVDTGCTRIFAVVVGIVIGMKAVFGGGGQPAVLKAAARGEMDMGFLLPMTAVGLLFTVVGAFVAGKLAGRAYTLHGMLSGITASVVGLLMSLGQQGGAHAPLWFTVCGFLAAVPCGFFGGWLAGLGRPQPS